MFTGRYKKDGKIYSKIKKVSPFFYIEKLIIYLSVQL